MNKDSFQQLLGTISPSAKILYYDGSFDPFHLGHLSALQKCIDLFQPDIIFILAHEKNKYKPNLIDFSHRTQMIILTVGQLPYTTRKKIYVLNTPGENHAIKNELQRKFCNLALLMGTDSLRFFNFDRHQGVQKFFISVRKDESIDNSIIHKVIPFEPNITDCSSTKIRHLLKEFYFGKSLTPELLNLIHYDVNLYIQINHLYYPSFGELIANIRCVLEDNFQTKEITPLFQSETRSKNYCFKIGQNIVKCFTKQTHYTDCVSEYEGIILLHQMNITFVPPQIRPNIQHFFHFSYLVTELIDNADVRSNFENCNNDKEFTLLCQNFATIGSSLAELHSSQPLQLVEPTILQVHFEKLETKLKNVPLTPDQFNHLMELKQKYSENPGCHTLTHGDTNLGNFIITSNKIYLLDLDRLNHCNKMGNCGFPCEDYFRFIASIHWFRKFSNNNYLTNHHINQLIQSFSQSYHKNIEHKFQLTKQSIDFYSYYWQLRDQ